MPFVNVVLNSGSMGLLRNHSKVRIRFKDGYVQFLPTNRRSEVNLPKGERLRPVVVTSRYAQFSLKEATLYPSEHVLIETTPYGWCTILLDLKDSFGSDGKIFSAAKIVLVTSNPVKKPGNGSKPFDLTDKHVSLLL